MWTETFNIQFHTPNYCTQEQVKLISFGKYIIFIPAMFTPSCIWVWVCGVRQSLFNAAYRSCKWKHHTLPKCSHLNAGVWRALFAWLSVRLQREAKHFDLHFFVLIILLVPKNGHLHPNAHSGGMCVIMQPPAGLFKCLFLLQQCWPCRTICEADFQ